MNQTNVTGVAPMFLVDDVVTTAEWYRDTLGFTIGDYFAEDHAHDDDGNDIPGSTGEVFFVMIRRDGHRIMLGKTVRKGHGVTSNGAFKEYASDAYFWCDNVDPIAEQAAAAGAKILYGPLDQPYGMREFSLNDRDGRVLTFGAAIAN